MMFIAGTLTGIGGMVVLVALAANVPFTVGAFAVIIGCAMVALGIAVCCIEDDRRAAR